MTGTAVERHEDRPGFLDFDEAKRRAVVLAESGMVPDALRNNPSGVMLVGLYGQDLGVPFVAALSEIHVIKGRVSASAQLRLALIHRAGHEARFKLSTAEKAVIIGRRREDRDDPNGWVEVEWTIEQAEKAKLLSKDVWKQYPAEMLRARAASALCRMHFSDVLLGLDPHTPEELGADIAEVDFAPGEDQGDEDIVEAELVPDAEEAPHEEEPPPDSAEQVPEGDTPPHDTKQGDGTDSGPSHEGPKEEPARPLAQQIAIQANKAGLVRGEVILAVSKGRTSSGREVTAEEGTAVLQAIDAIARGDLKLGEIEIDDEDFGGKRKIPALVNVVAKDKARPAPEPKGEPAKAKPVAPPAPGPAPATKEADEGLPRGDEDSWDADGWRQFLKLRGVKVTELLKEAHKLAKEIGEEQPATLEGLKGSKLTGLLRGFVEELAETRAS